MRQKIAAFLCASSSVSVAGCTSSTPYVKLAEDPVAICSTYSDIGKAEVMDGPDFRAYRWENRGLNVKLYVGLHPDYPGMKDISAKHRSVSKVTLVHDGQTNERVDQIYAYPSSYGFPSFVHLSVSGGERGARTALVDELGGTLRLCEGGTHNG
jgi:hypothetical protein